MEAAGGVEADVGTAHLMLIPTHVILSSCQPLQSSRTTISS
jgi:hypothetical protein